LSCTFVLVIESMKFNLQFLIEFTHIFRLVCILIQNLVLDLKSYLFVWLFQLELFAFLMVDLLFASYQIFRILFTDVPVLGQQLDMLYLKV
jgi:hypothetical protein